MWQTNIHFGTTVGEAIKVTATDEVSTAKLYVKFESEEWFSPGNTYTIPKTERNGRYYFYSEDCLLSALPYKLNKWLNYNYLP